MATTATRPKKTAKAADAGAADRLQSAVGDVERLAERASGDARKSLEDASRRIREIAVDLRKRAESESAQFEQSIQDATEDARRELGRRAIRAQRSPEALSEMSAEIRRRRSQLSRAAKAAGTGGKAHAA
jgi:hypothetical protein